MKPLTLAETIANGYVKPGGVIVKSRAELVEYLRRFPLQLRAGRPSPPPRAGDPDFVGPVSPFQLNRVGGINYDSDGGASFTIHKEPWERERDEKVLRLLGDL